MGLVDHLLWEALLTTLEGEPSSRLRLLQGRVKS